jgi:hypothetical protein
VSPASEAQLTKIVLQPSDFPAGWEHTPYTTDTAADAAGNAAQAAFAKCLGVSNSDIDKVAEGHSGDFDQGDAEISSDATSFRSQSVVDADAAALQSAKASPCAEQLVRQTLAGAVPAGGTIESVSFKITPGSTSGPANVVARGDGSFKVSVSGNTAEGYVSIAFISGPMIETDVTAFNVGAPVPTSLTDSLVAAVANRAAHP